MRKWDDLSMREKAEMMGVAVSNGITTLPEIKQAYNEFAEGGAMPEAQPAENDGWSMEGNLFGGGGYKPSERIKQRIANYEGKAMTGATDPLSGKWAKNNSFEHEAKNFYNALPRDIREQVLSNPELADSLYSYSYNVGAGRFKERVVPALRNYYNGKGTVQDIENSMWASGDSKLRGLQRRRAEERKGVRNALIGDVPYLPSDTPSYPTIYDMPQYIPAQPQAFSAPLTSYQPVVLPNEQQPIVREALAYDPKEIERQERRRGLDNFMTLLSMTGAQQDNGMLGTISMLSGLGTANAYREGGDIEIKPENRGKFTALKERTGHSATWFKEHGTPAQKKMATFDLNSRHWEHADGGNLFDGLSEDSQKMSDGYYRQNGNPVAFDSEGNLIDQVSGDRGTIMLPEYTVTGHTPTMWDKMVSRAGEVWNTVRGPLEQAAMTAGNLPFAIYGGLSKLAADAFAPKDTYANAHTPFGEGIGHERDNIINVANNIAGGRNRLEMMGFRKVDDKYRYPNPRYVPGTQKEPNELKTFIGEDDPEAQYEYLRWCAENANIISGYYGRPTAGNAWTRHGIYGDSAIVQAPYTKDKYYIPRASNKARSMSKDQARYVASHIDDPGVELKSGDIVDMRYPGSSFTSEAWYTGDQKLPNTHTGTIIKTGPRKEDTYVAHYFNKGLRLEPIGDLLGVSWTKPYVTGIRRAGTKEHPYK